MLFHTLCPRRKQLSEYLPPSVLKQKKKSSIVPPVSYKPYLEVQLYACLGINRFTGDIVQQYMALCQILVVDPIVEKTSRLNSYEFKRFIPAALCVPLLKLFRSYKVHYSYQHIILVLLLGTSCRC